MHRTNASHLYGSRCGKQELYGSPRFSIKTPHELALPGTHPSGIVALCLALLLCPALLLAAPADPLPLGHGFRARFGEKGVWRLESDDGVFLARCGLRLWTGAGYLHQASARHTAPPADGPAGRTFAGELRVGGASVRYWQTATPTHNGLLVQYAIAAADLAATAEIAAGFDLPVETFRGATCALAGAKPVLLPGAKPTSPRLLERIAPGLVLRRNGLTLSIRRRPSGKIIVQDGREWHQPYFQALLYADHAVGDPEGWRSITFLLTIGAEPAGPVLAAVVPGKGSVPCHGVHEAEVHFWAPCDNPFRDGDVRVWAKVATPSGQRYTARAFFARDYELSPDRDGERLRPVGHGRWRLRITPTEPGTHHYLVKVTTPAGEVTAKPISFAAAPSPARGFLHRPTKQARYLEDAAGEPLFLIGHNYCWPSGKARAHTLDAALDTMARAGINATRLWLCSWGIGIEGSRPDDYRLDQAWRLDRILTRARDRGIYVQLCLDNFYDLTAKEKAKTNPYLAQNGGPCRAPAEFFTSSQAKAQYRRRLDYLIARFAPYTSLLAWELCNEMDYATDNRRDPALLAWARDSASYLKTHDPYRHVVTTSLGIGSQWDALWQSPQLDMIQAHAYIHKPIYVRNRTELDAAALILEQATAPQGLGKPFLVAEFGFLGTSDFNPLNDADKTGIHLHNAIWASALAGCAGTAMHWWWDTYLPRHDLYYHYAALERFLRGEPLPAADWHPVRDKATGPVRVLGLKGPNAALLWIQHRDNRWYRRLIEAREPTPLTNATIDLTRLSGGRYRIEWWDTYAGQPLTHVVAATSDGKITLRVPPGHPDIACKVRRVSD